MCIIQVCMHPCVHEAKLEPGICNSSMYVCGINSKEEEEEENVDVAVAREKKPTYDDNFVKRAWSKYLLAC